MIETSDLIVFTKVVELECLTKAGMALNLPKWTVSRRLTRLEEALGTPLLRRTTHSVTTTEQGQIFFEYALRCLGVLQDGERAILSHHQIPQGIMRVAFPAELDRGLIGPILSAYVERYPEVSLAMVLVNEHIDVLRGGFDVAIVAGSLPLAQSSLTVTKIGQSSYDLYASPHYIERHGWPRNNVDLGRFDLLAWGNAEQNSEWLLVHQESEHRLTFRAKLICNDLMLLRHSALSGMGIAALPDYICKRDLERGDLVQILPGWQITGIEFHLVFPRHDIMPIRLRTFVDFLVQNLRPKMKAGAAGT